MRSAPAARSDPVHDEHGYGRCRILDQTSFRARSGRKRACSSYGQHSGSCKAIPEIRRRLDEAGCFVPLVGDFHYNGHKLLTEYPECAEALSKYRINPGNVGKGDKQEENFRTMIELAKKYDKPVRIGVNWGSLDQDLLARMMSENQSSRIRSTQRSTS